MKWVRQFGGKGSLPLVTKITNMPMAITSIHYVILEQRGTLSVFAHRKCQSALETVYLNPNIHIGTYVVHESAAFL